MNEMYFKLHINCINLINKEQALHIKLFRYYTINIHRTHNHMGYLFESNGPKYQLSIYPNLNNIPIDSYTTHTQYVAYFRFQVVCRLHNE